MIALTVWLLLSSLLALTGWLILWYLRNPDDAWWVPFAAPYLITWCAVHNARRRPYYGLLSPGNYTGPPRQYECPGGPVGEEPLMTLQPSTVLRTA